MGNCHINFKIPGGGLNLPTPSHGCDKRLQRLQKNLCKRIYYFVKVYLNKSHMSETKQNYDGKPSYSALRSITDRDHWVTVLVTVNSCLTMEHLPQSRGKIKVSEFLALL